MKFFAIAALVSLLPVVAQADCARLRGMFRVPVPEPGVAPADATPSDAPLSNCSPEQAAMFLMNFNALEVAAPVTDPSELYGTWLSDDVLFQVLGLAVGGQEVLRISEGPRPDTVMIEQFWYAAGLLLNPVPFKDGRYSVVVAKGPLRPSRDGTAFEMDYFENPMVFAGPILSPEARGTELWILSRINHFDVGVSFARDGDTLVLKAMHRSPEMWLTTQSTHTYTRVADWAPDLAYLVVRNFELSQTRHFECLVHQFSEGTGAFVEGLGPDGIEQLRSDLEGMIAFQAERDEMMKRLRSDDKPDPDTLTATLNRGIELTNAPMMVRAREALADGGTSGCPSIDR